MYIIVHCVSVVISFTNPVVQFPSWLLNNYAVTESKESTVNHFTFLFDLEARIMP